MINLVVFYIPCFFFYPYGNYSNAFPLFNIWVEMREKKFGSDDKETLENIEIFEWFIY